MQIRENVAKIFKAKRTVNTVKNIIYLRMFRPSTGAIVNAFMNVTAFFRLRRCLVAYTVKLNNKKKSRRGFVINSRSGKDVESILVEVWFKAVKYIVK